MSDQTAIDRERKNAEEAVAAWHKKNDARHDAEERAEKAEAEQARLRAALQEIRNGLVCAWGAHRNADFPYLVATAAAALAGAPEGTQPVCKVRAAGKTDPPQDCDWPFCGCDERATKVIEALEKCGWRAPEGTAPKPAAVDPDDREGCTCAPRDQRGWRDPHCPDHGEFPLPPPPEPTTPEGLCTRCGTEPCAEHAPPAAPLHASEGTIRERLLRHADLLAERKRLWQLPPDTETSIALLREAAAALQVADPLHAAQVIDRLENYYDFQCEGGPLKNCVEWHQLKSLLSAPAVPSSPTPEVAALMAIRHWSKDPLVPYADCQCGTCAATPTPEAGAE